MKKKIINKLALNTSVITGCILCGFVLNKNSVSNVEDFVKFSVIVSGNVTSNAYLLKKHLKI